MEQQQKEAQIEIPLFTKTEVKDRGWTEGAIRNFLGTPDKTAPNPYSRKQPDVKLFSRDRVKQIERTEEWQAWYQKIKKQRSKRDHLKEQRFWREEKILEQNPVWGFEGQVQLEDIQEEIALDYDEISSELRVKIQEAILNTLKKSWWYPVDRLLIQFYRTKWTETLQSLEHIDFLAQSIFEKGWKGRPLIALDGRPARTPCAKEFLHSGYHRLEALKQLRREEKIGNDFLVPVFPLPVNWIWLCSQMPKEDQKILDLVDGELHHLTLKELCRHGSGFLPLVTGLDNY